MDESLLASKGISPLETAVGYVEGYALHIGERATLLPESDGRACGVLMKIRPKDLEILYSDPSVSDYVAENVLVRLPGDRQEEAVCYNLPEAKLKGTNPEYAAKLLKLAGKLNFPGSYLQRIE